MLSVRGVSTLGTLSPSAAIAVSFVSPVVPTDIITDVRTWEIEAQATVSNLGTGTTFNYDITQGDGTGYTPEPLLKRQATAVFTGLIPNTEYTIYAQTTNVYGQSAWYSETHTTQSNDAQVRPFLRDIENEIQEANDKINGLESAEAPLLFSDLLDTISEQVVSIDEKFNNTNEVLGLTGLVESVEKKTDDNTTAISALYAMTGNADNFAAAQLILNSTYEAELNTLEARAFLGVDINNRVTGINIQGEPANSVIDFIGDKVRFVRPDDLTIGFQWSAADDEFVFDGKIIARDSTFTGTVTASVIQSTTINGGTINASDFIGGTFTGGTFTGATFTGNTINGGTINGGTIQSTGNTGLSSLKIVNNVLEVRDEAGNLRVKLGKLN